MSDTIKVMVVEDSDIGWEFFERTFKDEPDIEIALGFKTMQGVQQADLSTIDVVLMDGSVDRSDDGYDATYDLLQKYPDAKIVIASFAPDYGQANALGVETLVKGYGHEEELVEKVRRLAGLTATT